MSNREYPALKFLPDYTDNKRGCNIKKLIIAALPLLLGTALFAEEPVRFHQFPWGTSIAEFTAKMGKPVQQDEIDGLRSLIYENIEISGYTTYMVAYFSASGLEGGTYYFLTRDLKELMKCYQEVQKELLGRYGPTRLCDVIIREMRPYESSWNLESGFVYLKVNTRRNEPVTLWYSSPALTIKLFGS